MLDEDNLCDGIVSFMEFDPLGASFLTHSRYLATGKYGSVTQGFCNLDTSHSSGVNLKEMLKV